MRRALAAGVTAFAAILLLVGLTGASSDTSGGYRVDAIFTNAGFLIPGQDVKIAGAKVGSVEDVTLTDDRKARVEMLVDEEFAPFRGDASCTVQPQSLIGEKFVQCTPGTPGGGTLPDVDGVTTVPIANTTTPIDLDLVLATFREPTTTQASLLLSALGGGLVGRAGDLNEAIRQADPAFKEVDRLLELVNGERETIRSLISESDTLIGELADRREDVADFISGARSATAPTARRTQELRATLRELPGFLSAARPALRELRGLGETGTPIVRELLDAAPAGTRLVTSLSPFARAGEPALRELGRAAAAGRAVVEPAAPQIRRLRRFAEAARPTGALLGDFLESSRDQGAIEGVLRFVYWGTAALSRFDSVSHILPAFAIVKDSCSLYAQTTVPECAAHFDAGETTAGRRATRNTREKATTTTPARPTPTPARAPSSPPATTTTPRPQAPGTTPPVLGELPKALQETLGGLLGGGGREGGLDQVLGGLLGGDRGGPRTAPPATTDSLLDYLLRG